MDWYDPRVDIRGETQIEHTIGYRFQWSVWSHFGVLGNEQGELSPNTNYKLQLFIGRSRGVSPKQIETIEQPIAHTHNQQIITTNMIVTTDDHFWPPNSGFPPNYHDHDPTDNLPDEPSTITICDHPCLSNNDNILHTRKWPPWPLVSGVTRR